MQIYWKTLKHQAHSDLTPLLPLGSRGVKTGKGNEVALCLDLPGAGRVEDHMQPYVSVSFF